MKKSSKIFEKSSFKKSKWEFRFKAIKCKIKTCFLRKSSLQIFAKKYENFYWCSSKDVESTSDDERRLQKLRKKPILN